MKSLLIKDTTVSERAQIVREALGADGDCEGIDLNLHGVGGINTWGARTLPQYTLPGNKPYSYGFIIEY